MEIANIKEIEFEVGIKILAMKRAGQHAIINWIIRNTTYNVYFANNVSVEREVYFTNKNSDKNILIYNIEDYQEHKDSNIDLSDNCKKQIELLVLRDPLNLFSSRKKVNHPYPNWFNAKGFDIFNQHVALSKKIDTVYYNQWVASNDYRKELADTLGLPTNLDETVVSTFGNGSSFTKTSKLPSTKELLSRWKSLSDEDIEIVKNHIELEPFKHLYENISI